MKLTHRFAEMPWEKRPQDPHMDGTVERWFDKRDLDAVLDHEEPLSHPASDQAQ
jgi:hypothetical protein